MTRSADSEVGEVSNDTVRPGGRAAGKRLNGKGAKRAAPIKRASERPKGNKTGAKRKPRTFDPDKLDQFGFRLGSKKSKAAAMYGSKNGATLEETKKALKSTQYNVLTELEEKGYKIKRSVDSGDENRKVTRFHLVA